MGSEWPFSLWDENTFCRSSLEDCPTAVCSFELPPSDLEEHRMTPLCPMLDHSSDHSLFSAMDSSTCFPLFDQPSFHDDVSANLSASFQGQTSCHLNRQDHWDPTEASRTKISGSDTAKNYDCTISRPNAPRPFPLGSDRSATRSLIREAYGNGYLPHSPCQASATGKAIKTKSTAPRKRGRPRRYASPPSADFESLSGDHIEVQSSRLPHTAVERKYREGLNAALERLRQAVPTLPQRRQRDGIGTPRPSKSMIIAGAVKYIERLESEKTLALTQNQTLKRAKC